MRVCRTRWGMYVIPFRHPAGTPSGGQFASRTRADLEVELCRPVGLAPAMLDSLARDPAYTRFAESLNDALGAIIPRETDGTYRLPRALS